MAGLEESVAGLPLTLGLPGGCGTGFGKGDSLGPPFVPPEKLADENISACGANEFATLQGSHFICLADMQLHGQLRVLRPGQGLGHDVMPKRLNVQVDGNGIVSRVFCG